MSEMDLAVQAATCIILNIQNIGENVKSPTSLFGLIQGQYKLVPHCLQIYVFWISKQVAAR